MNLTPASRLPTLALALGIFAACGQGPDGSSARAPDAASGDEAATGAAGAPYFVYIGTSTDDPSDGIHVLRFDPADGSLEPAAAPVARVMNPSFLALSPDRRTLYAVSEVDDGQVVAFRRDPASGALTVLGRRSSGGAGPAHVSADASGRWVAVANYGGGSVALLPVAEDGSLGDAVAVVQHEGHGPNPDRQEAPHAHQAIPSPEGHWVFVTDLGTDRVTGYPLVGGSKGLDEAGAVVTRAAPGSGPRHLAFHPDRPFVYLLTEMGGAVTAYRYHADTGRLDEIQTVSAVPADFSGKNESAEIQVHPNGRWLYASNRGDFDSIAIFEIDRETGRLTPVGHEREGIVWPRSFVIDPTGRWMLVANRHAGDVRVYAIDPDTGRLRPTSARVEVAQPTDVTLATGR